MVHINIKNIISKRGAISIFEISLLILSSFAYIFSIGFVTAKIVYPHSPIGTSSFPRPPILKENTKFYWNDKAYQVQSNYELDFSRAISEEQLLSDALKIGAIKEISKFEEIIGTYNFRTDSQPPSDETSEFKESNIIYISRTDQPTTPKEDKKPETAEKTTAWKYLGEGLKWAGGVLVVTTAISKIVDEEKEKNVQMIGFAISGGILAGTASMELFKLIGYREAGKSWWQIGPETAATVIGILTAYLIAANNFKKIKTKEKSIEFKCLSWQAPDGGSNCEKCNDDVLKPCSEYRCKALGKTCKIINQGTGLERCIDGARDDVLSPGIRPWNEIITKGYSYSDVRIRPPGSEKPAGMRITYQGGCLPAFQPVTFGIETFDKDNKLEPTQCKIDFNHTEKFDSMGYYMGGENKYLENHSEVISLPGLENINLTIPGVKNDAEYSLYIRCKDGNGNENRDEFVVSFCTEAGPDVTAPIIKTTSIPSGSAVQYKVDNVSIEVYTNEPAECRWSRKDASYSNMENQMSCSNKIWEMNAQTLYTCKTTLTSVKDKEENKFYFRCADVSKQNNTMQQSYEFVLYGTQPLNIIKVGPNGTISGATSTITVNLEVSTDNGFKNGEATCYYSTASDSRFIEMVDTGSNKHKQPLDLIEGSYTYYYKCIDAGGNTATNSTTFNVFVDKYAPAVLRAYSLEGKLVIITDEISDCYYSTESCNFDISKGEGISMPYAKSKEHYAEFRTSQSYYIKCMDEKGNVPDPTECSFILRPYKILR